MKHRKLRIAWSVAWGILAVLLIALWVRTVRFQDRGGGWITSSYYGYAVAFNNWLEVDIAMPQQPDDFRNYPRYQHGFVRDSIPNISPVHRWYFGASKLPSTTGVCVRLPIWVPVILSASLAVLPWISRLTSTKQFSLRTLLIATTLVAVGLGLIVRLR